MNYKKIILPTLIFGLLFSAGFVLTAELENPIPDYNSLIDLLLDIAKKVGELIAIIGVIMIVWAGILYLTSAGDPQKFQTANKAMIYAVIGIAIGVSASTIVEIVKELLGA